MSFTLTCLRGSYVRGCSGYVFLRTVKSSFLIITPLFWKTLLVVSPPDCSIPHTNLFSRLSSLIALKAASLYSMVSDPFFSMSNCLAITRSLPPTMPSPSRSYDESGILSVFLCINIPDLVFFWKDSLALLHHPGTSKNLNILNHLLTLSMNFLWSN